MIRIIKKHAYWCKIILVASNRRRSGRPSSRSGGGSGRRRWNVVAQRTTGDARPGGAQLDDPPHVATTTTSATAAAPVRRRVQRHHGGGQRGVHRVVYGRKPRGGRSVDTVVVDGWGSSGTHPFVVFRQIQVALVVESKLRLLRVQCSVVRLNWLIIAASRVDCGQYGRGWAKTNVIGKKKIFTDSSYRHGFICAIDNIILSQTHTWRRAVWQIYIYIFIYIPCIRVRVDALRIFAVWWALRWTDRWQPFGHRKHVLHPIRALRQCSICRRA